eukprot:15330267-Ditylum_brightwellii.AAC.1
MEKRMELPNSTYNHFFLENTHFEFCMSRGPHTYQTRNPLPDKDSWNSDSSSMTFTELEFWNSGNSIPNNSNGSQQSQHYLGPTFPFPSI